MFDKASKILVWIKTIGTLFIKRSGSYFVIIVVYVDDLNIIGTPNELSKFVEWLTKEFEMKDFGKTKFCLDL